MGLRCSERAWDRVILSPVPDLSFEVSRRALFGLWVAPLCGTGPGPARNVILYGSEEPLPEAIRVHAGPVTAEFEPGIAMLRYLRYGDSEILRAVYAAVRDKVWGTVPPRVTNVVTEQRADSFRITFDVECKQDDIDFRWTGTITGDPAGTVRFDFAGRAESTFQKNRLGFAVLHPIKECAGRVARIETADGGWQEGRFPDAISPHQPFLNLRAISHGVAPGVWAEVRMEGDIFEMEDHRNWTDHNYKTYCTPLARPYPVEVRQGQEIRQSVTVKLTGAARPTRASRSGEVTIGEGDGAIVSVPAVGVGMAAFAPRLTDAEAGRLRAAGLRHLRVDLPLYEASWRERWARAAAESAAMGAGIEAAVHVSGNAEQELREFAAARGGARVVRWLLFHKDEASTRERWIGVARKHLTGAPLGAGTDQFFTELNRERPPVSAIDFTCYSINPQVHAFDNRSLVENLEAQAETVRSCRKFAGGKPIAVTPVTFRMRFNPQAKGSPEKTAPGRLPARVDPRQMSLFGAAWTVGSLKHLAEAGAASITYYETHGWGGLMETAQGSAEPGLFRSTPGMVFPLYHVLADFCEAPPAAKVRPTTTSDPLRACALLIEWGRRRRLLAANLTPTEQVIAIDGGLAGPRARLRVIDEHSSGAEDIRRTFAPAGPQRGSYRIGLGAYAVALLESA